MFTWAHLFCLLHASILTDPRADPLSLGLSVTYRMLLCVCHLCLHVCLSACPLVCLSACLLVSCRLVAAPALPLRAQVLQEELSRVCRAKAVIAPSQGSINITGNHQRTVMEWLKERGF